MKRPIRKTNASGMDAARLRHLMKVMQEDIDADRYFGGVIAIGRHGKLALHEAIGHADSARKRPVKKDSVFSLFSVTKAIPWCWCCARSSAASSRSPRRSPMWSRSSRARGARRSRSYHLLTHSSGLPSVYSAREGMYIDRLDEMIAEICKNIFPMEPPGLGVKLRAASCITR